MVCARLTKVDTVASKLLRFIALTGVRYAEAAGARQVEFDLDPECPSGCCRPSGAMIKPEHRVPPAAVEIVRSLWREGAKAARLLFEGSVLGRPVSNTRLRTLLRENSDDFVADADTHG
jgi:hypothetical protein